MQIFGAKKPEPQSEPIDVDFNEAKSRVEGLKSFIESFSALDTKLTYYNSIPATFDLKSRTFYIVGETFWGGSVYRTLQRTVYSENAFEDFKLYVKANEQIREDLNWIRSYLQRPDVDESKKEEIRKSVIGLKEQIDTETINKTVSTFKLVMERDIWSKFDAASEAQPFQGLKDNFERGTYDSLMALHEDGGYLDRPLRALFKWRIEGVGKREGEIDRIKKFITTELPQTIDAMQKTDTKRVSASSNPPPVDSSSSLRASTSPPTPPNTPSPPPVASGSSSRASSSPPSPPPAPSPTSAPTTNTSAERKAVVDKIKKARRDMTQIEKHQEFMKYHQDKSDLKQLELVMKDRVLSADLVAFDNAKQALTTAGENIGASAKANLEKAVAEAKKFVDKHNKINEISQRIKQTDSKEISIEKVEELQHVKFAEVDEFYRNSINEKNTAEAELAKMPAPQRTNQPSKGNLLDELARRQKMIE